MFVVEEKDNVKKKKVSAT